MSRLKTVLVAILFIVIEDHIMGQSLYCPICPSYISEGVNNGENLGAANAVLEDLREIVVYHERIETGNQSYYVAISCKTSRGNYWGYPVLSHEKYKEALAKGHPVLRASKRPTP